MLGSTMATALRASTSFRLPSLRLSEHHWGQSVRWAGGLPEAEHGEVVAAARVASCSGPGVPTWASPASHPALPLRRPSAGRWVSQSLFQISLPQMPRGCPSVRQAVVCAGRGGGTGKDPRVRGLPFSLRPGQVYLM